jgi:hypothetical protein
VEVYSDRVATEQGAEYGPPRVYMPDEEVPVVVEGREVARVAVSGLLP